MEEGDLQEEECGLLYVLFSSKLCNYKIGVIRKQLQDHFIHMCLNPKP